MMRTLFFYKKIVLVFVCFLLSFSVFSAEKKVPDWYEHKEVVYPGEFYISAIGEGITKEEAEIKAISQISLFFPKRDIIVKKEFSQKKEVFL